MKHKAWNASLALVLACSSQQLDEDTTGSAEAGGSSNVGGAGGAARGGAGGTGFDAAYEAARMLSGRFDSSEQAAAQPEYHPVQLHTCEVSAPELGEHALYVEQALMSQLNSPYRQRLYVVEPVAGEPARATSRVFELVAPQGFVGLCDEPGPISVAASEAVERSGCRVELSWSGDHFEGATPGKECLSDFQGATYATSEVALHADRITSWDRGWSGADVQVWGATAGPYVFIRRTPIATDGER